jgi:hypothetical protein
MERTENKGDYALQNLPNVVVSTCDVMLRQMGCAIILNSE